MEPTNNSHSTVNALKKRFVETFGGKESDSGISVFFCPGRVNLIGEYTDFTGGLVFPFAIDRGTLLVIRASHNRLFRFASTNEDEIGQLTQDETADNTESRWLKYPTAVINQFHQAGFDIDGVDVLFSGNIPSGAGLSSSASIEVVTAVALNTLFECSMTTLELVRLCQSAENEFVGTKSGIMDQFAVAFGEENHAVYLDCQSLDYRRVPVRLNNFTFVIAHTGQTRENSESAYNDRVSECELALQTLQAHLPIKHLGQVTPQQLMLHRHLFEAEPLIGQRLEHIVAENERVRQAVLALEVADFETFGQLMDESHASLRDLFEVSSEPLDHMVRIASAQPTVLGSRLTGAGFGGCTINLLAADTVETFKHNVREQYRQATALKPEFYQVHPSSGARRLSA
ncbi:UNVERIFIED_CONTAM: hypothetical protein GTU68_033581 [Idotea baltica]|nr:hypothetical protein [Idotea baltica]